MYLLFFLRPVNQQRTILLQTEFQIRFSTEIFQQVYILLFIPPPWTLSLFLYLSFIVCKSFGTFFFITVIIYGRDSWNNTRKNIL